jgi:ribulose-bisphosphate carboxylase large chain
MQAIEAWQEGISLEEKAKKSQDLKEALEKWGHYKPV